jgi:spermidine synthase
MGTLYESGSIKVIEVADDDGDVQRQLLMGPPFENVQGAIKTSRPKFHVQEFTRNLMFGAYCQAGAIESALFLGLGVGVVVQSVRDLYPTAAIDIVDLDPDIFSVASEYFFRIDSTNVRWFSEDALDFVSKCDRQYDYICCDIWGHHLEPPRFLVEPEFFARISRILSPSGAFSMNTQWYLHKQLAHTLTAAFAHVLSLRAYNSTFVATRMPPRIEQDEGITRTALENNLDLRAIAAQSVLMRPSAGRN